MTRRFTGPVGRKAAFWGCLYGIGYVIAAVRVLMEPQPLGTKLIADGIGLALALLGWFIVTSFSVGVTGLWRWLRGQTSIDDGGGTA